MSNKEKPILLAGLIIIIIISLLLVISPLSIFSGSDFVPPKQQQAMAQNNNFKNQIEDDELTNISSFLSDADKLYDKGIELLNAGKSMN
jgi:hypothetical protein